MLRELSFKDTLNGLQTNAVPLASPLAYPPVLSPFKTDSTRIGGYTLHLTTTLRHFPPRLRAGVRLKGIRLSGYIFERYSVFR